MGTLQQEGVVRFERKNVEEGRGGRLVMTIMRLDGRVETRHFKGVTIYLNGTKITFSRIDTSDVLSTDLVSEDGVYQLRSPVLAVGKPVTVLQRGETRTTAHRVALSDSPKHDDGRPAITLILGDVVDA